MTDILILVNEKDEPVGYKEKIQCHLGRGMRHRAFSIFIFNSKGEVLIQQRSKEKMLWGGYWSNTCCSHPRKGEDMREAAHRRLFEEMGFKSRLTYAFKFRYSARFKNIGSENEFCSVFIGRFRGRVKADPSEAMAWKFIDYNKLLRDVKKNPRRYTPWFKIELRKLQDGKFNPNQLKPKKDNFQFSIYNLQ